MEQKMSNPLNKYFRQPAIFLELPSQGRYWRPGSLELPENGQIPIYPMTARDEILLKTPDALMNGTAMAEVFQSCSTAIKDGWSVPKVDVDALLIGIRIASYGQELDIDTTCPHCGHQNRHGFDLADRLEKIRCPDFDKKLKYKDMLVKFKPSRYFDNNATETTRYHEEKLRQVVDASEITNEEKIKYITEYAKKMMDITINIIAAQTEYIQLDDGVKVIEREHIQEFYSNIDGDSLRQFTEFITKLYAEVEPPMMELSCQSCTQHYQSSFEFDYANFFDRGF